MGAATAADPPVLNPRARTAGTPAPGPDPFRRAVLPVPSAHAAHSGRWPDVSPASGTGPLPGACRLGPPRPRTRTVARSRCVLRGGVPAGGPVDRVRCRALETQRREDLHGACERGVRRSVGSSLARRPPGLRRVSPPALARWNQRRPRVRSAIRRHAAGPRLHRGRASERRRVTWRDSVRGVRAEARPDLPTSPRRLAASGKPFEGAGRRRARAGWGSAPAAS